MNFSFILAVFQNPGGGYGPRGALPTPMAKGGMLQQAGAAKSSGLYYINPILSVGPPSSFLMHK